jgi:hypothetical protein
MEHECAIANKELWQIEDKINGRLYPLCGVCFPPATVLQISNLEFTSRGLYCGCRVVLRLDELDDHLTRIVWGLRRYYSEMRNMLKNAPHMPSVCGLIVYKYV